MMKKTIFATPRQENARTNLHTRCTQKCITYLPLESIIMNPIDIRQIRVFISSTFEDMKDERDYLIKKVFPELKQKAAEREVSLIDVDLRWGITEEQAKKGQVIDICFKEIDNSIPFFIGIVGNRYGWRPEKKDISNDNCLHYETIKKYIERHLSVTEMEIQYGVLEREQPMYAFFYIDSREIDSNQIDYPEQLNNLKYKIKGNKRYPWNFYSSKIDLGNKVKEHFVNLLDTLFPIEETLSEVELLELRQRINLNRLCSTYIPDESRFSVLDSFVNNSEKSQLIIVGESGIGKSAFVAEWVNRNQSKRDIVYYAVGCGGNSSDKDTVLNQLASLVNHKCNNTNELDNKNIYTILNSLAKINKELIVVLDGFNQIELRQNEKKLQWFPEPQGKIKFVITIATDRDSTHFNPMHINSRNQLSSRDGAEEFVFKELPKHIRKRILETVLTKRGKHLNSELIKRIASCKVFRNCLSLRILSEELIIHPKHETIKEEILKYLKLKSIDSFLFSVLDRYEQDYGKLLVRKSLLLLAISENGFDEQEIRDLINEDLSHFVGENSMNCVIPSLEWSQFYCAFKDNFSVREGGLLGFSHQLVRNAVLEKYVSEKDNTLILSLRKLIIGTFQNNNSPRAYLELRHQYQELGMHEQLHKLICRPEVFYWMLTNCYNHLTDSWIDLCVYSEKYYPAIDCINVWNNLDESKKAKTYNDVEMIVCAIFVEKQGYFPFDPWPWEFAYMQELCLPYQKKNQDLFHYTYSAGAGYLDTPTQLKHALSLLLKALSILEEANMQESTLFYKNLISCYSKIAQCYHLLDKKNEEIQYLKSIIEVSKIQYGEFNPQTQFWYYQVGYACFKKSSYTEAIEYLKTSLMIAERTQDNNAIIDVCNGLVQCYIAAFKNDKKEKRNTFLNEDNYSMYLYYYEKMAIALKENGQIEEYKSIIKNINDMKKSL